jgi:hypothetical protein
LENEASIREHALENFHRNENGDTVIKKDDPWYDEDHWDELYEKVKKEALR